MCLSSLQCKIVYSFHFVEMMHHGVTTLELRIIYDYIVENDLDILCLTETWLHADQMDGSVISQLCPPTHKILSVPRLGHAGGVAMIYNSSLAVTPTVKDYRYLSFELLETKLIHGSKTIHVSTVYRPPPSTRNKLTVNLFIDEFSTYLEGLSTLSGHLILCGDFNFHVDVGTNTHAQRFLEMTQSVNLRQHVDTPTHAGGHTLDFLFSFDSDDLECHSHRLYNIRPFRSACQSNHTRTDDTHQVDPVQETQQH